MLRLQGGTVLAIAKKMRSIWTSRTTWLRVVFLCALAFALVMALVPKPPHLPIDDLGDKFEHGLAFMTLTFLGALSYPKMPLPRVGERLSFLGAMIEVTQSIPALHRDCDIMDWVTDTAVILVTLVVIQAFRRTRGPGSIANALG
jgi:membrane protease YdiL (CAAX protease family)